MNCNRVRDLIDGADRADVLPREAARHIDSCLECAGFAEKRMRLRELLASTGRVTAPANFDAMLRARLTERSGGRSLPWMVPALYLRFAGAAIVLLCVFLLGQQLARNGKHAQVASGPVAEDRSSPAESMNRSAPGGTAVPGGMIGGSGPAQPNGPSRSGTYVPVRSIRPRVNPNLRYVSDYAGPVDPGATTAAVLLMRGPGAEREVMVPAVSVGAQPIFYYYKEPQSSRGVRVSF